MNKTELVSRTFELLKERDARKKCPGFKTKLRIVDEDDVSKEFIIKRNGASYLFTKSDVKIILDATLQIVLDAITVGESVEVPEIGTLGLSFRKPSRIRHPVTGEIIEVRGKHTAKLYISKYLKRCALVYEMSLRDGTITKKLEDFKNKLEKKSTSNNNKEDGE